MTHRRSSIAALRVEGQGSTLRVIVPGVGPDAPYRAPYALISDIHGNARALDAVLAELERFGIDDGIVLGDVAQGGDEPAAVLDRLADLGWPVILGNADHLLLEVPTRTNEVITAEQLGAARVVSLETR